MKAARVLENQCRFSEDNDRLESYVDSIVPPDIDEVTLYLYCECADKRCKEKIAISHKGRKSIKNDNLTFVVIPGHYFPELEDVLQKCPEYWVIHKIEGKLAHVENDKSDYFRADHKKVS